jgi:hypothetical protein
MNDEARMSKSETQLRWHVSGFELVRQAFQPDSSMCLNRSRGSSHNSDIQSGGKLSGIAFQGSGSWPAAANFGLSALQSGWKA